MRAAFVCRCFIFFFGRCQGRATDPCYNYYGVLLTYSWCNIAILNTVVVHDGMVMITPYTR